MFPGQPLEHAGRLPDDPDLLEVAAMTRQKAGLDLYGAVWIGPELTESVKLQVYGVAMSLYHARKLQQDGITPAIIGEHSMGVYAALSAAGSLAEEEALELAYRIGCTIAGMGGKNQSALGCVIGLRLGPLLTIARNNGVYLANHNTSRHYLISGERERIVGAVAEAIECGAFSARTFACDAPLHTPLMSQVADDVRSIAAEYRYRDPVVALMNHIDQGFLSGSDMADFVVREMLMPVYWEKTFLALKAAGAARFYEVGAGESLKKYNRWIDSQTGA